MSDLPWLGPIRWNPVPARPQVSEPPVLAFIRPSASDRGPVTRASVADQRQSLPTELIGAVRERFGAACAVVRTIEMQMLAPLTPDAP